MPPVLLIHGYSAESATADLADITSIYGELPAILRAEYGDANVFELDVSRYITLDDGVTLDDIAFALDRALQQDYSQLLDGKFRVIIHSTGALVIRNWIRRFSLQYKNRPLERVIYLAGALFGSGWAHIGKGQLAKWGRWVFQSGAERGVQVLEGLELGSEWTLDLHIHFLSAGSAMLDDYGVREAAIIGSAAHPSWFVIPIRYAHEDGSDGVVRVAAGNPSCVYVRIGASDSCRSTSWDEAAGAVALHQEPDIFSPSPRYYEITYRKLPGDAGNPASPLAVAYDRAHTGETGIVQHITDQVRALVRSALDTPDANWTQVLKDFDAATAETYREAAKANTAPLPLKWLKDSRAQYDGHAQVIFRMRDQDGRPVKNFDIFFNNVESARGDSIPIGDLFEDKHVNERSSHCICFYLRLTKWNGTDRWVNQLAAADGCDLEITATEPYSDLIRYLPLRVRLDPTDLAQWIRPHTTTIVDVELFRIPAPDVFVVRTAR